MYSLRFGYAVSLLEIFHHSCVVSPSWQQAHELFDIAHEISNQLTYDYFFQSPRAMSNAENSRTLVDLFRSGIAESFEMQSVISNDTRIWVQRHETFFEILEAAFLPEGASDHLATAHVGKFVGAKISEALAKFAEDQTPLPVTLLPEYSLPRERWPITTVAQGSFPFNEKNIIILVAAGFIEDGDHVNLAATRIGPNQFCLAVLDDGAWKVQPVSLSAITEAIKNESNVFEAAFCDAPDASKLLAPYFEQAFAIAESCTIAADIDLIVSAPTKRIRL